MERLRHRLSLRAHLLIVAMAIMGLEVDVVSNPFSPEFVLARVFALLDGAESPAIFLDSDSVEAGGGSIPIAELADEPDMPSVVDETVAIRIHGNSLKFIHAVASRFMPSPLSGNTGRELSHYAAPDSQQLVLACLCRFLC